MYYSDSGNLFRSPGASALPGAHARPAEGGTLVGSGTMSPGQVVGRQSAIFKHGLSRGAKIAIGAGTAGMALMVAIILFLAIGDDGDMRTGAKEAATSMRVAKAAVGPDVAARDPRVAFIDAMSPRPRPIQRFDAAVQIMRPPPPLPQLRIPKMVVHLNGLPRRARVTLDGKRTDPPFVVNADGRDRKLVVDAPGYSRYKTGFIATGKEITIEIRMVRRRYRWQSMRPMRPRTGPGIIVRPMY